MEKLNCIGYHVPRFGKHDGYLASSRQRYNDRFFDLTSHEMIGG